VINYTYVNTPYVCDFEDTKITNIDRIEREGQDDYPTYGVQIGFGTSISTYVIPKYL
jgi:hypothetical protein